MSMIMRPIGFLRTDETDIPRHWSVSDVKGRLIIEEEYREGLRGIEPGQSIIVLFHFHRSPEFGAELLIQTPRHKREPCGVFSICSPIRPNPIGLSVLKVTGVVGSVLYVEGVDMYDGTPILDIKPFKTAAGPNAAGRNEAMRP